MKHDYTDIFNSIIGEWLVERVITPGGSFEGKAVFERKADGVLDYKEEGRLTLDNGKVLKPTKSYQWRLESGSIVIYFNDGVTKGELFHRLEFTNDASATAKHLCSPDTYNSEYGFADMPRSFTITHEVDGPNKRYVSVSAFTKA